MARIVVIVGHARTATYCEALGESYVRGARTGGHEVKLFVTSRITFDSHPARRLRMRSAPLEKNLSEAHDAILAVDYLVFIFPLWLGMLPAILKGFLERVMQPDVTASKEQSFPSSLKASPHVSLLRWECLA